MNFYDNLPKHFVSLAPMEAVTDLVFRQVVAQAGRPDLFYTEFTCVDSFVSPEGHANAVRRLRFLDSEQPIVAQIWGSNPDNFEKTAYGLKETGYQAIDINTGCPDKAVVKTGGGSDLIRHPEKINAIIKATKKAGLPVSVKTRLGFSRLEEWPAWITNLLEQDLPVLTIHLRTRKEMSKVPAHFELIPEIIALRDKIAPQTKIVINGDIADRQQAEELCQKYGADGAMIGRGVFANPCCFTDHQPSRAELINLLKTHLDLFDKASQEQPLKFEPLKKFFKIYINHFPGAKELRNQLMNTTSTDEVREIINATQK